MTLFKNGSLLICLGLMLLASQVTAVHVYEASEQDPWKKERCTCRNWRELYASPFAQDALLTCGAGHELFVPRLNGENMLLAKAKYCWGFYEQLNETFCVNIRHDNTPGQWDNTQWCYTSPLCRMSSPANGTWSAGVRRCVPGKDNMLRSRSPDELFQYYGNHSHLDFHLLLKMAYPVEQKLKFEHALSFMGSLAEDTELMAMTQKRFVQRQLMKAAKKAGKEAMAGMVNLVRDQMPQLALGKATVQDGGENDADHLDSEPAEEVVIKRLSFIQKQIWPVVIESIDGQPPLAVVHGKTVHIVTHTKAGWKMECKLNCPVDAAPAKKPQLTQADILEHMNQVKVDA
mmetsp:Transcript_26168/g.59576  ORF Transcript_26168/g.59576 Transcript_26168/m.59576 type:complete len:345 (+) Transcript_26168:71-1105(+)|eukprot:CAMPEP_0197910332 /NCGR_PEP_ID=MMETSP1439-20131203/70711_1 /TAXON_ID=66791 /ORGANISM="Gonyaulax spinifera, Strain CCMP409" /LENGTH=344 /DNA_ID=CAMNT_0043531975 /DNA_START=71 /DNA_END=1105 /DNA_ORIENTATION=-